MSRIDKSVFISYRRTNFSWALAVWQNLAQHGYDVFIDYDGIRPGDFENIILENITSRAHFLIVLTPSALERCSEPNDMMRREIEMALGTKRNIVSLMLEGFSFGTPAIANQLTGTLAPIKRYQGLSVPNEFFLEAMERLRTRFLNVPLTEVTHPPSAAAKRAATEQNAAAEAAPPVQEQELTAHQHLEHAVASLQPGYRMVFVLHDVEGFDHNEIATMLECSISDSKSQLQKARLKLRQYLNREGSVRDGGTHRLEQMLRDIRTKQRRQALDRPK
jgi:RNA polymerase sigma factor (sigma-70 family)